MAGGKPSLYHYGSSSTTLDAPPTLHQGFAKVLGFFLMIKNRKGHIGPYRLALNASTDPLVAGFWGLDSEEPGSPRIH